MHLDQVLWWSICIGELSGDTKKVCHVLCCAVQSDGSSRADLDKAAASTPLCSYLEAGNHNNGGTPILEEEDSAPILQEESSAAVSTGLIDTPMQSSPLQPGLVGGFWADNDDDDGGMFGGWGGVVAAEKAAEEASQAGSQDVRASMHACMWLYCASFGASIVHTTRRATGPVMQFLSALYQPIG